MMLLWFYSISRLYFLFKIMLVVLSVLVSRQNQKPVPEVVTSVTPRERPKSNMVPGGAGLTLPIQTFTPRRRPSVSNPATPIASSQGKVYLQLFGQVEYLLICFIYFK